MVQEHRVFALRWYPHTTPGAMLVEMDLIGRPQINLRIPRQFLEFF